MPQIHDKEFIDISTAVTRRIEGPLPFGIYVKRAPNTYTKIVHRGDTIDINRIDFYEAQHRVERFYVHQDDYRQYLLYAEQVANQLFEDAKRVPTEEFIEVVKDLTSLTMLEMVTNKQVDACSIAYAAKTVRGCIEALVRDKIALVKIFKLFKSQPYIMRHSVSTAMFSIMLAREADFESDKSLMDIGLGALLHDIGMSRLTFESEGKDDLSPREWKELKQHTEIGKRLLDQVKIASPQVKTIVLQHHEQPNGGGYPNGLYDKGIYYPAKIVAVADSFSALISDRPFRKAFSPVKALEVMVEDHGKFDLKLLDLFTQLFVKVKAA